MYVPSKGDIVQDHLLPTGVFLVVSVDEISEVTRVIYWPIGRGAYAIHEMPKDFEQIELAVQAIIADRVKHGRRRRHRKTMAKNRRARRGT